MNHRRLLRFLLSLNLAIPITPYALGLDDGDGDDAPPAQIQSVWASSFSAGLEQSQVSQKPLLVVFGAEWCSWCRKLEKELATEAASAVRQEWMLAKVDVDEEEELASQYGVQALPTIVVVDTTGAKIESVEGYMPIDQLAGWLEEQKQGAVSVLDAALQESADATQENIAKWVSFLGDRRSSIRQIAKQKFLQHRSKAWSSILPILETGSLAQRLSAMELLEKWKAPSQQLDPWHPETFREDAIQSIRKWLEENTKTFGSDEGEAERVDEHDDAPNPAQPESSGDASESDTPLPDEIVKHINKWRSVGENGIELLLAETYSLANEKDVIRGLKKLILEGDLGDQAKTNARFAYYNLLSGATIRSEHLGLLKSLAGLDEAKRRRAGVALAQKLSKDDSRLLIALIEDQDSVIREASVEVISKVDSENAADWLDRLLRDPDRNVRGMSLKTLAPSLSTRAFPIVAKYLPTETDENLIVQGFKFLGSESNYNLEKEYLGLIPFLEHDQWRIRAEATEFLGKQLQNQVAYQRNRDDTLTQPIIEGLSSRLLDPDSFVRAKVQEHIPNLVNVKTLPKLAKLLVQNVELLDQVLESSQSDRSRTVHYGMGSQSDENIKTADFLISLKSDDDSVRLVAAIFLADSKPERALTELAKHVTTDNRLLKSKIVHHAIRAFNSYRDDATSGYLQTNAIQDAPLRRNANEPELDNSKDGLDLFDLFGDRVTPTTDRDEKKKPDVAATGGVDVDDFFGGSSSQKKSSPAVEKSSSDSGQQIASATTEKLEIDEPDLFGVANKPEQIASVDSKTTKPGKRLRNFKEWMANWNSEETPIELKSSWKQIASQLLQSQDAEDRNLGLILSPIVGLPIDQKEWLALLSAEQSKPIAASVVGWLPMEWTEPIGDSWTMGDKKLNQVFLKSFTSAVEPKRLIWLANNKERFAENYIEATMYVSACLRTVLGSGIKFGEPDSHFGNYFKLDKATEDVRLVVEELVTRVKRDDASSAFAMAVLLKLVPKETESLCMELLDSENAKLQNLAADALLSKSSFANTKLLDTIRSKESAILDRWILNYLWANQTENQYQDIMLIHAGTRSTQQTDELLKFLKTARRSNSWKDWLKVQIERNEPEVTPYLALMQIALDPEAPIELLSRYPGNSGSGQSLNLIMTAVVASTREDAATWLVEHFKEIKAASQNEYLNSYSWNELLKSRKGEWIKLKKLLEIDNY
ncbi:MAG: thioredoxin domain-containing protein [Pirellula sp.]|jgi:thioredoxin-related protein/HEAT repeat protein|nr:thioredoxin domain-containing protein [Pirellula sp.]